MRLDGGVSEQTNKCTGPASPLGSVVGGRRRHRYLGWAWRTPGRVTRPQMEGAQRPQNTTGNRYQVLLVESLCHIQVGAGAWSPGESRGTAGQLLACSQGKSGFREPEGWQEKGGPRQAPPPHPSPPVHCGCHWAASAESLHFTDEIGRLGCALACSASGCTREDWNALTAPCAWKVCLAWVLGSTFTKHATNLADRSSCLHTAFAQRYVRLHTDRISFYYMRSLNPSQMGQIRLRFAFSSDFVPSQDFVGPTHESCFLSVGQTPISPVFCCKMFRSFPFVCYCERRCGTCLAGSPSPRVRFWGGTQKGAGRLVGNPHTSLYRMSPCGLQSVPWILPRGTVRLSQSRGRAWRDGTEDKSVLTGGKAQDEGKVWR